MGSIDGLKEQVEELKQRLNDPGPQKASKPDELKTRLASIKASLESKQGEITELLAEKQRFAAEIKRLAAENKRFAADQERLAAERQQLSAENDQLRKMLKDVLTALDGQLADASTNIISEFLAETDPLVKASGGRSETVIAAGPPKDLAAAGPSSDAAKAKGTAKAPPQELGSDAVDADEEESPALRRIMKRGHRAAG